MNDLRIAVAGTGHLGTLHARMLAGIPGVRLAGVYDIDREKARTVAAELNTRAFASMGELLAEADAVTVATPTSTHYEVATLVLDAGRHLFIEKPITQTVEEAADLCRQGERHGVCIQVGHIERFNPAILALDSYEIRPMFVESHRLSQFNPRGTDVAVVLDLMIHDIDLIMAFVRSPVKTVEANGVPVVSDSIDIANARLQFQNGCVANVTASRISQRRMRKMRMFQPDTYISIDFAEGSAEIFRLLTMTEPVEDGAMVVGEIGVGDRRRRIVFSQPAVREINALQHELKLFAHSVRTNTPPLVSAEDGRRALEVASIIMERIGQQGASA